MRSVSPRFVVLAGVVAFSGAVLACGSNASSEPWEETGSNDSGAGSTHDGGGTGSSSGGSSSGGGSGSGGSSSGGGSQPDSGGGTDAGTGGDSSGGGGGDAGADTGTITSDDGFAASRQACINKINALRATDTAIALQPYTLVNTDTTNSCVDTQATNDQAKDSAHYSFINNDPSCTWGSPNGEAQDECEEGYGTTPAGIEQCLQDMWNESLNSNCTGCIGCTAFGGACPNCDYSGQNGPECGHYVNMSAPYFTQVACGFAGAAPSSTTGWSAQNFE